MQNRGLGISRSAVGALTLGVVIINGILNHEYGGSYVEKEYTVRKGPG